MKSMTVEERLGLNRYITDEQNPHIIPDKEYPDREEVAKVVRACPAGLYKLGENGELFFDYLGCLECGTCRIVSGGKVIQTWGYPRGGLGGSFRYG